MPIPALLKNIFPPIAETRVDQDCGKPDTRSLRRNPIITMNRIQQVFRYFISRGMRLQVNVVIAFFSLIFLISAVIVIYINHKNSNLALQHAETLIANASSRNIDDTVSLLEPVVKSVEILAQLGTMDETLLRQEKIVPYLIKILDSYPYLYSASIAFEDSGRFIYPILIPSGLKQLGPKNSAIPPDSKYALRIVEPQANPPTETYTYLSANGRETGSEVIKNSNFDPRSRLFYKGAKEQGNVYLSDISIFPTLNKPGISIGAPIYDKNRKLIGVSGANMILDSVSDFLKKQQIGERGIALIIDESHQIIAHPDKGKSVRIDGRNLSLLKADEIDDPVIRDAFRTWQERKKDYAAGDHFLFKSNKEEFIASFKPFPDKLGKKWTIVTLVPSIQFVGSVHSTNRDIILITVLMTLIGILGVNLISGRIAKPIDAVIEDTKHIRRFELDHELVFRSHITEVKELVDAMRTMKTTIRDFTRFVPKKLVQRMLATGKPIELGGQSQYLTILFTDLANFSSISERMPARDLMLHVSEHFDVISRCIVETDGTIDKYIGDSVMAFWGAPEHLDNHAYNACVAALQAKKQMDVLNAVWKSQGSPELHTRFGLHTDAVIVGNIGSSERYSYTVMGDGVNLASRLEGVNKVYGTQICVSNTVFKEVGDRLLLRPVDLISVKGRRSGQVVYELMGSRQEGLEISATTMQKTSRIW